MVATRNPTPTALWQFGSRANPPATGPTTPVVTGRGRGVIRDGTVLY